MAEFLKTMEGWDKFSSVDSRKADNSKLIKAVELLTNKEGLSQRGHEYKLEEAVGTSDFPYLFGQIIDRQLLASYKAPVDPLYSWEDYFGYSTLANFNPAQKSKVVGKSKMLSQVPERGEYQYDKPSAYQYELALKKYGKGFGISWESLINDSMNAFGSIPGDMATAAKDTEGHFATSLMTSASGPNSLLYGDTITDCGQDLTNIGSLPLTIANLEKTIGLMKSQKSPDGVAMRVRPKYLVVPPQLELTARAILTSTFKQWTEVGSGGGVPMPTANVLPQTGLQLRVNEWLPYIDTTAGDTTWYLMGDPRMSGGSAVEFARLRGNEQPEVVMKSSNKVSVSGGGEVNAMSGSFENDTIEYRVRIAIGGAQVDPRMTYAQVG